MSSAPAVVRDGLVYDFIPEYGSNWHVGPILLITLTSEIGPALHLLRCKQMSALG